MADTGKAMTLGDLPELFLPDPTDKVPPVGPQEEPDQPDGSPVFGGAETSPTQPATESTGETAASEESRAAEETTETTEEPSPVDPGPDIYPYLAIGGGVLSAALLAAVIVQTIKLRKAKRNMARLAKRKSQAVEVSVPAVAAPSEVIQVGKLHFQGARSSQQDCLAVSPAELYRQKGMLAVVADGMGGLSDGDRMSQAAAGTMMNAFMASRDVAASDLILALTTEANQAVNRLLGPQKGKSGTTLVAGIVKDGMFHYVSVGDSRICLFRQGQLTQLNREHVYRNELATQAINGVGTLWDANTHPKAGALTSYLGMGNLKYVDIPAEPVKLRGGDKLILMSDGVYNAMSLMELETAMAKPAQQAADAIGQIIHTKAYRNQDNYTAVILEF